MHRRPYNTVGVSCEKNAKVMTMCRWKWNIRNQGTRFTLLNLSTFTLFYLLLLFLHVSYCIPFPISDYFVLMFVLRLWDMKPTWICSFHITKQPALNFKMEILNSTNRPSLSKACFQNRRFWFSHASQCHINVWNGDHCVSAPNHFHVSSLRNNTIREYPYEPRIFLQTQWSQTHNLFSATAQF